MKPQDMSQAQLFDEAGKHQAALLRLRTAIGLIGIGLPIALLLSTVFPGVEMQNSISEFFFTPVRDVFVMALAAIGVFLINYHGHDPKTGEWLTDYWVTTLAGVTAIIVALVPTVCDLIECYRPLSLTDNLITGNTAQNGLHLGAAGVFLACLAIMSLILFVRSGDAPAAAKLRRNLIYRISGWLIVAMLGLIFVFKIVLSDIGTRWDDAWQFTFWAETVAVWAFGTAWLVKGEAVKPMMRGLYDAE